MSQPPATSELPSHQFTILGILGLTAVVGVIAYSLIATGMQHQCRCQFRIVPADDAGLKAWFAEELPGISVQVERNGNGIQYSYWQPEVSYQQASPPWQELGYGGPVSFVMTSKPSTPIFKAMAIYLLVIALGAGLRYRKKWWAWLFGQPPTPAHETNVAQETNASHEREQDA